MRSNCFRRCTRNSLHVVEHQLSLRCSQRHGICSYPESHECSPHPTTPQTLSSISTLISSPLRREGLQSSLFPSHLSTKCCVSPNRKTSSTHLNLLYFNILYEYYLASTQNHASPLVCGCLHILLIRSSYVQTFASTLFLW